MFLKGLEKRLWELKNQSKNQDHPDDVVKIGLNTQKDPQNFLLLRLQWKTTS